MTLTAAELREFLGRWCVHMQSSAHELNALEARLGNGDLGVTLEKCAELVQAALPSAPDSISDLFKMVAKACMAASGSSFGTLIGIGFVAAAKSTAGRQELDVLQIASVLRAAADAISQRGGAVVGDETFLDAMLAACAVLEEGPPDPSAAVQRSIADALTEFRGKPNRIGRARMFAEQSIGLDDPGMIAFRRMVQII